MTSIYMAPLQKCTLGDRRVIYVHSLNEHGNVCMLQMARQNDTLIPLFILSQSYPHHLSPSYPRAGDRRPTGMWRTPNRPPGVGNAGLIREYMTSQSPCAPYSQGGCLGDVYFSQDHCYTLILHPRALQWSQLTEKT